MKEKDRFQQLTKLIQENPELPILPMVYYDVVGSDIYRYWLGEWGRSEVKEYIHGDIPCSESEGAVFFKDDDVEDVLNNVSGYCDNWEEMTEEQMEAAFESLPWEKGIVVYIGI